MLELKLGLCNIVIQVVYTHDFQETLMKHFFYYIFRLLQRLSGVANGLINYF